jgi:hypothetical protein
MQEERELRNLLDWLAIAREHQIVRPLAHRGAAEDGIELTVETLVRRSPSPPTGPIGIRSAQTTMISS